MNIPDYRAKINIKELARGNNIEDYLYKVIRHYVNRGTIIKNQDDYYAIGRLNYYDEIEVFDVEDKQILKYPYFKTTLAVHFPDMIDSQGNKIFASLSEDGKGGDKYYHETGNGTFIFSSMGTIPYYEDYSYYKIIGIQE